MIILPPKWVEIYSDEEPISLTGAVYLPNEEKLHSKQTQIYMQGLIVNFCLFINNLRLSPSGVTANTRALCHLCVTYWGKLRYKREGLNFGINALWSIMEASKL